MLTDQMKEVLKDMKVQCDYCYNIVSALVRMVSKDAEDDTWICDECDMR